MVQRDRNTPERRDVVDAGGALISIGHALYLVGALVVGLLLLLHDKL